MTPSADDVCISQENSHRAIQNEYIVEHLFSFLSVEDIKNCRLANRMWMKIGTKILRRRTHVVFDFSGEDFGGRTLLEASNRMKEVHDYCLENTPEDTPITSFAFKGEFQYFQLAKFLDDMRGYTKELKMISLIYYDGDENIAVDISPKIPPHLTKLHMRLFGPFDVTLRLDQISFVKDIYLDCCTIIVETNGKRLAPTNINLGFGNKYIKNGTQVKFLVNESFDLTLTKEIDLDGKNLILDFSDCANDQVKRIVTLNHITVQNWEMCNWKIKKFSLSGISFLYKNFIEIEELTLIENLTIDLSKIYNPTSLLMLCCEEFAAIAEAPFFLPNLVDVTLKGRNAVAKLPYFTNNKHISKMELLSEVRQDDAMSVNVNHFPNGIHQLSLTGIGVHGEGVYPLQTLIMEEYYPVSKYLTFGSKFRPETFRIWNSRIDADAEAESVVQLLNSGDSYGRLVIGSFDWGRNDAFHDNVISNFVDREAEYYVFQGKKGKSLTEEESNKEYYHC